MEINLQKQYEKVLLLIFGLVALGVGGFLLFKSLTSDVKRSVGGVEGSKTVSAPITEIENASKLLAEGATWEQPRKAEKPVFFAVSTPILRKGEEVYDMQDREKEIRADLDPRALLQEKPHREQCEQDFDEVLVQEAHRIDTRRRTPEDFLEQKPDKPERHRDVDHHDDPSQQGQPPVPLAQRASQALPVMNRQLAIHRQNRRSGVDHSWMGLLADAAYLTKPASYRRVAAESNIHS